MELKDIVSITGKPGLYRIVSRTNKSVVVEALDEKRTKFPIHPNYQVAMLEEITIYTDSDEELTLKKVFENIHEKDGKTPSVTHKAEPVKLRDYFKEVAPDHDEERVYLSDIKKLLKWYEILSAAEVI